MPVVAVAGGQVVFAGWDWTNHEAGLGLVIEVDHNNNYKSLYGHLSLLRYGAGTNVGRWQIGTSGTTGNSTAPHLHFEMHVRQNNNWRVTDPYGWSGSGPDPWITHSSGATSYWLWVSNPLQTRPARGEERYTDDGDLGYLRLCNSGGGCPFWYSETNSAGYGGDFDYTYSVGTTSDYFARWYSRNLPSTGQYEVEVYIPYWDASNPTHAARYKIVHAAGSTTVVVDQHDVSPGQWISFGRYNFDQGVTGPGYVEITDAAYVAENQEGGTYIEYCCTKEILVDAVRWVKTH